MQRLTVFAWAVGAGIVMMFAGMVGAEALRWHSPLWYDGEVIQLAGFCSALTGGVATAYLVAWRQRRASRWMHIAALGLGLGVLAAAAFLYCVVVF